MPISKNIILIPLLVVLTACSNTGSKESLPVTKSPMQDSSFTAANCQKCYDSLTKNNIGFESIFDTIYKNVLLSETPQQRDFCLLFWFTLHSTDESLNESMGEYVFTYLKASKHKQKMLTESLKHFPENIRDSLYYNLLYLMYIDVSEYETINQFEAAFPYFNDSVSVSVASEIIEGNKSTNN